MLPAMIAFDIDPKLAEQQMRAIIYYLTAFGYIDGDFDQAEKQFVREYVRKLVDHRARGAAGPDEPLQRDVIERWTKHFDEVVEETDYQIQSLFTESVAQGESTAQFVIAKLKLRCFELFKRFDDAGREILLSTVDELMRADGTVHPSEEAFRRELEQLLHKPIELDEAELEAVEAGSVVIGNPATLTPTQPDHPFFKGFEVQYAKDPETFALQSQGDMQLISRVLATLEGQRKEGKGRLAAARELSAIPAGSRFLDEHVYVLQPAKGTRCELLVLGDLHGCYSCLKGALLQADFFNKVQAHLEEPEKNPEMNLVLLGDYIDRGRYSYNGILRTVMQLFVTVPDHVYLLRGNHEYYVEVNGRVLAPVRPAEAMTEIADIAPTEVFATYMRLFEALPNTLVFDKTLFVHAGIPREDTIAERYKGIESLNDPEIRFQMLWSDPSEADAVPRDLQNANARFPFGRKQFKSFMARLGLRTLIRGHERIVEGFKPIYDDPDGTLLSLFSAGGATNDDLPPTSNYREVTPMALTIKHEEGVSELTPFAIDYARYNDPRYNAFFRDALETPR
jgi:uncharacterized tellurite resistance protein B-like protein